MTVNSSFLDESSAFANDDRKAHTPNRIRNEGSDDLMDEGSEHEGDTPHRGFGDSSVFRVPKA
jgi:hypothetical protein